VYDFDTVINRRGTGSLKWDMREPASGASDLLPLWVADMDFPAPREIVQALERRIAHPIYGYTLEPALYFDAMTAWYRERHGWTLERDWVLSSPGVVPSISIALLALTEPGDGVVIQPPVYHPFAARILASGRRVVENPLTLVGSRLEMDFDALERVIDARTRALILCSPHNPGGRVWGRGELTRLSEICARRGILIISDEIHCDLVMKGHRHVPMAVSCEHAAGITVTFVSPTKTFNLAGIGGSFTIIPDASLRRRFAEQAHGLWTGLANPLSIAAVEAAYLHGAPWLDELLAYIGGNFDLLASFLTARLPGVRALPLEGTYLAWLDTRGLGLRDDEIAERLMKRGKVWLDEGRRFGRGGEGFQRLNLACPRAILRQALEKIAGAIS
jgi:cystathionine beta-lyase